MAGGGIRIQELQSQAGVPTSFPYRPVDRGSALVAATAVHGLGQLQHATQAVALRTAELLDAKRRQEQSDQAIGAVLDATKGIEAAENSLKFGTQDASGAVVDPAAGPNDYLERWQKSWTTVRDGVLATVPDPGARQAAAHLLTRTEIERYTAANNYANRLFVDRQKATYEDVKQEHLQYAAAAQTPEELELWTGRYKGYAASKVPVLGAEFIQKELRGFDQEVALVGAHRAINAGTFKAEDYAGKIDPLKVMALIDTDIQHARVRQQDAEKAWLEQKHTVMGQLALAADDGRLKMGDLPAYQEGWRMTPEEVETLRHRVVRFGEGGAGDPDAYKRLAIAARSASVTQSTRDELRRAYSRGDLNNAQYDHLDNIAESSIRQQKSEAAEGRSERRFQYQQYEERLRLSLRIKTFLPDMERESEHTFSVYQDEFLRRYTAGEAPADIYNDVLPRAIGQNREAAAIRIKDLQQSMAPYNSFASLEDAYKSGKLPEKAYNEAYVKIREIERIQAQLGLLPPAPPKKELGRGGGAKPAKSEPVQGPIQGEGAFGAQGAAAYSRAGFP